MRSDEPFNKQVEKACHRVIEGHSDKEVIVDAEIIATEMGTQKNWKVGFNLTTKTVSETIGVEVLEENGKSNRYRIWKKDN